MLTIPKIRFKEMIASFVKMLKTHDAPHEIALGVSIGCFIAILPLYGFHTILCVLAAILIPKANKLAILLGASISIPPTVATITWTAYDIGRSLLKDKQYPPLSWEYLRHFQISKISDFYYPLFIGSVVLGIICAAIAYFLTVFIVSYFRNKRLKEKCP